EAAGITQPADLLGRAHIIAGVAADETRVAFSRSALERDVDNGLAYEFVHGDVVFITVRDPDDASRGFTFSLTLSGRESSPVAFGLSLLLQVRRPVGGHAAMLVTSSSLALGAASSSLLMSR